MQKAILLAVCSFFLLNAAAQKRTSNSFQVEQIKTLEKTWLAAQYAMDTATLFAIFDETFTSVEPQTVINKKEALEDVVASIGEWKAIGISVDSFRLKDFLVRVYGNTAVSTFISTVMGKDNNQPFTKQVHYHHIWYLQHGKWKAVSSLNTRIAASSKEDEQTIKSLIAQRELARNTGDREVGNRILHPSYTSINEIGGVEARAASLRSPNDSAIIRQLAETNKETQFRTSVDSFHIQFYNNVAIVKYRLFYRLVFNGEPCEKVFQCNEVMMKGVGAWRSVSHTETVIPAAPYLIKTDTARFKDFAGRYQLFPGHVYNVISENGKLYWGKTNRVELIPQDVNTFVPNGREYYRVRFDSSADGRVTSIRIIEYPGVEYSALRIQ